MNDKIYISLASFTIQLNLHETEAKLYKKKFLQDLKKNYGNCLVATQLVRKVDFSINLFEDIHIHTLTKEEFTYIELFIKNKQKKSVSARYSIGIMQFGYILRQVLSHLLLTSKKGVFIHCSSVITPQNTILVFTGESGSGKSTISKMLSNNNQLCSDDIAVIKKEKDGWRLYQVPSFEKTAIVKTSMGYAIHSLFFLHQSKTNNLIFAHNMQNNFHQLYAQCFLSDAGLNAKKSIFSNVMKVVSALKIYNLSFNLDKGSVRSLLHT